MTLSHPIEKLQSSDIYLLTSGHHLQVGKRAGVYRIRAFDAEAIKGERSLHEEYRRKYLDRPPLDAKR